MSERCGHQSPTPGIVCDRERGHAGSHRGYGDEQDEVVFWDAAPWRSRKVPPLPRELVRDIIILVERLREHLRDGDGPVVKIALQELQGLEQDARDAIRELA